MWWLYTVCLGSIPFLIRILIFLFVRSSTLRDVFNAMDATAFGLVLLTGSLAELETQPSISNRFKRKFRGGTVCLLILMSFCLTSSYLIEAIKSPDLNITAVTIVSFFVGFGCLPFTFLLYYHPKFR